MTDKTVRTLLRKKTLTSLQRVQVLREAHRRLDLAISCFAAVQDACDAAAEQIMKHPTASRKEEAHADRLEETRDALEAVVEYLDNADTPDSSEVR
jgi:hypothetical protein